MNMSNIKVPIAKPIIGDEEIENVVEVLKSGMIAQGPKVAEFEQKFAEWVGAKYGIEQRPVNSCHPSISKARR